MNGNVRNLRKRQVIVTWQEVGVDRQIKPKLGLSDFCGPGRATAVDVERGALAHKRDESLTSRTELFSSSVSGSVFRGLWCVEFLCPQIIMFK